MAKLTNVAAQITVTLTEEQAKEIRAHISEQIDKAVAGLKDQVEEFAVQRFLAVQAWRQASELVTKYEAVVALADQLVDHCEGLADQVDYDRRIPSDPPGEERAVIAAYRAARADLP